MARKRPLLLTDEQWGKIEPLLPALPDCPKGGRPRCDDRRVLEGILWILRTGARWCDLPDEGIQYGVPRISNSVWCPPNSEFRIQYGVPRIRTVHQIGLCKNGNELPYCMENHLVRCWEIKGGEVDQADCSCLKLCESKWDWGCWGVDD